MLTVNDLLKTKGSKVWSIEYTATVMDALKLMAEKGVGALPVVKENKLVGIFSERDYARKAAEKGGVSLYVPITELMTSKVYIVKPTCGIDECMAIMTDRHIRHIPVLEKNKLVGIISIGDVVKGIISTQTDFIHQLEDYIQGKW
jgi:CBS domain-containing protein